VKKIDFTFTVEIPDDWTAGVDVTSPEGYVRNPAGQKKGRIFASLHGVDCGLVNLRAADASS